VAKLPTVTSDIPRDLRTFLDRVREAFNATGEDELVTVRKLVGAGLAEYSGGAVQGTTVSDTLPAPPAPLNLSATGALGNIIISWDPPRYAGHAYAEIWAAEEPVGGGNPPLGDAVLVGMAPGAVFSHDLGQGATRWYWVKFVNRDGQDGAFNAVEGTQASTGTDPAYVLGLLSGELSESQLNASLATRIDLVDAGPGVPGSVDARVSAARADASTDLEAAETTLQSNIDTLQAEINDLIDLPFWDAAVTYGPGDQVRHDGGMYAAAQTSTNIEPPNAAYWDKVGNYASLGDAVIANNSSIGALESDVTNLSASITNDYYTIAQTDSAISASETTLQSNIDGVAADLSTNYYTSVETDSAISSATTTLQSNIEDPNGASVGASLQQEATTRASETGDLFAQYTVKTDVNGYVSGYGLASTAVDGTPSSEFIVRSDTFAIASPSGGGVSPYEPFIVRTTSTTINGETVPAGVYIRDAVIQNGTIGSAKIGDAAVDSAKIADLAVVEAKIADASITSAKIANLAVDNAKVADAAITKAKIADLAVDSAKIADATITNAKIADLAVDSAKVADLAVDRITLFLRMTITPQNSLRRY